jgi:hypothetical protein
MRVGDVFKPADVHNLDEWRAARRAAVVRDDDRDEGKDTCRRQAELRSTLMQDHRHRLRTIRAYEYRDAATLLADYWTTVDAVLRERGVIP